MFQHDSDPNLLLASKQLVENESAWAWICWADILPAATRIMSQHHNRLMKLASGFCLLPMHMLRCLEAAGAHHGLTTGLSMTTSTLNGSCCDAITIMLFINAAIVHFRLLVQEHSLAVCRPSHEFEPVWPLADGVLSVAVVQRQCG